MHLQQRLQEPPHQSPPLPGLMQARCGPGRPLRQLPACAQAHCLYAFVGCLLVQGEAETPEQPRWGWSAGSRTAGTL